MVQCRLKFLFASFLFLIFGKQLIASRQLSDYIIYKNDTIPIYHLILENYLQNEKTDDGRLFGLSFRNLFEDKWASHNCWRGYQAIYKIENDSLFLCNIIKCFSIEKINKELSDSILYAIFGNQVKDNKVFVDWFSGDISFPVKSKDIENEVIRFDGVFERIFLFETLMEIENGIIKCSKEIQNYEVLPNRINRKDYEIFRNFLLYKIKNYKWKKKRKSEHAGHYVIRINKEGRIYLIDGDYITKEVYSKYSDFSDKREYRYCIRSIKKALKGLEFDIIKRKGEPIEEYVGVGILFEDDGSIEIF